MSNTSLRNCKQVFASLKIHTSVFLFFYFLCCITFKKNTAQLKKTKHGILQNESIFSVLIHQLTVSKTPQSIKHWHLDDKCKQIVYKRVECFVSHHPPGQVCHRFQFVVDEQLRCHHYEAWCNKCDRFNTKRGH